MYNRLRNASGSEIKLSVMVSLSFFFFWMKEWSSSTYRLKLKRRSASAGCECFPEVSREDSTEEYRSPFASRCGESGCRTSLPPSSFTLRSTGDAVQICAHFSWFSVRVTRIKAHYRANASALRDTSTLPLGHRGRGLKSRGGGAWRAPIPEKLTASIRTCLTQCAG